MFKKINTTPKEYNNVGLDIPAGVIISDRFNIGYNADNKPDKVNFEFYIYASDWAFRNKKERIILNMDGMSVNSYSIPITGNQFGSFSPALLNRIAQNYNEQVHGFWNIMYVKNYDDEPLYSQYFNVAMDKDMQVIETQEIGQTLQGISITRINGFQRGKIIINGTTEIELVFDENGNFEKMFTQELIFQSLRLVPMQLDEEENDIEKNWEYEIAFVKLKTIA
jgi:hypothetical protein